MQPSSFKFEIILLFFGLAILGCKEAWAEDWKSYEKTDFFEAFYDVENVIRSSQDTLKIWTKLEYTQKGVIEMLIKFGKHYENLSYSLELREINCAEKKDRLLSITAYSEEGNILYTDQAGTRPPPWKVISRGSVEENLYKALCK